MNFSRYHKSVSHKILGGVVLIGAILTLISTIAISYSDYQSELGYLDKRFLQISESFEKPLALSMWNFDEEQIKVTLNSIFNQADIVYVSVFDEGSETPSYEVGEVPETLFRSKEYPLQMGDEGEDRKNIGVLKVYASLGGINDKVLSKAVFFSLKPIS